MPHLFTIGHSTHPVDHFVELLRRHGVSAVADVRSVPYSRFNLQYNREPLAASLQRAGIEYVHLGFEFGARRHEPECQTGDGTRRFDVAARLPAFQQGKTRLRQGLERFDIALMCAEQDPLLCHRHRLVCRHVTDEWPVIQHIREDGSLESQTELESRLLKQCGLPEADLFRGRRELLAEAYTRLGDSRADPADAEDRTD